uniref:Epoxide hydrolase 1 n=1 Tax=Solanum tuberosum TaxID=4113 RepID=M1ASS6_SOLTU
MLLVPRIIYTKEVSRNWCHSWRMLWYYKVLDILYTKKSLKKLMNTFTTTLAKFHPLKITPTSVLFSRSLNYFPCTTINLFDWCANNGD